MLAQCFSTPQNNGKLNGTTPDRLERQAPGAANWPPTTKFHETDAPAHEEAARTYGRQCRMPFDVTGHPALAMMPGLSGAGLPLSVQFVGPFHADALLLRVAASYERVAPWRGRRPAHCGLPDGPAYRRHFAAD